MALDNDVKRPVQFWAAIMAIAGLVVITMILIAGLILITLNPQDNPADTSTLKDATLLCVGGIISFSSSLGAWLFTRGPGGEAPPPSAVYVSPNPLSAPAVPTTPISPQPPDG